MAFLYDDSGLHMDATFHIEPGPSASTLLLHYEKSEHGQNLQYAEGLGLLLQRLRSYPANLVDAFVFSRDTQKLSRAKRRIQVEGYSLPVFLKAKSPIEIGDFCARLIEAQGRIGRDSDVAKSDIPRRHLRLILQIPGSKRPDSEALETHLTGRTNSIPHYWALVARPDVYRLADAVHTLSSDVWTTKGRQLRLGDRVVVWQARGRGNQRGVVALAEVIANPEKMTDASNPYWLNRHAADALEERVQVRYVIPERLPLWTNEPGNEFLRELSVAKAMGGTVFRVEPKQWEQIVTVAGGWEDADSVSRSKSVTVAPVRGQGRGLTQAERKAVEDYAMRRAKAYFSNRRIAFTDVSSTDSHDLLCHVPSGDLYLEVKGTTSLGEKVILTTKEVSLLRDRYPQSALFVTSQIQLDRESDPPVASGGRDRLIQPWRPSEDSLRPLTYECSLGSDYGCDVTVEVSGFIAPGGTLAGV